jgi:hypothetical protein
MADGCLLTAVVCDAGCHQTATRVTEAQRVPAARIRRQRVRMIQGIVNLELDHRLS